MGTSIVIPGGGGGGSNAYSPAISNEWGQTPPATFPAALDYLAHIERLVSSSIFYVAKVGNDANAGTSKAPYLTIQAAIDAVYAHSSENCVIVILDDGDYNEQLNFGGMTPRKNIKITSAVQTEYPVSTLSRPKIWFNGSVITGAPVTSITVRVSLSFDSVYLQGGIDIQATLDNVQIHLFLNKSILVANNYPIILSSISGCTLNECGIADFASVVCTNLGFFTSNTSHVWEYNTGGSTTITFVNDGSGFYSSTADKQMSIDVSGRRSDLANLNKLFSKGVFNVSAVNFSIINGGSPINFTVSNDAVFRAGTTITVPEFVNFSLLGCRVLAAIDAQLGSSFEAVNTLFLDDFNNDGTFIAKNSTVDGLFTGDGILDAKNSEFCAKTVTVSETQTQNDVSIDFNGAGVINYQLLPLAMFSQGRIFEFYNNTVFAVNLVPDGLETIEGMPSISLAQYQYVRLIVKNGFWGVLS